MPEITSPTPRLDARAVPAPCVVFRRLGVESVLLELERGLYFGLDEVATTIWQAFERRSTLRQTLDELEEHYSANRTRLEADLLAFVRQTLDAGLVECVPGEGAT